MMIGNQGGHVRKPVQPSRNCLSIQELKAMTALRMSQGAEVSASQGNENSQSKSSQQTPVQSYATSASNNSRSRRTASRAAATMYADQGDFLTTQQQPPAMTRVSPSPPPPSGNSLRAEKQQAHSLTVQELKELTRMRLAREANVPGSNNTSTSTDNDLDMELHHLHMQGVNRKNSANSLLTTTTLESRESENGCSHPQSRSGTISPVSDSFVDESEALGNNYGLQPSSLLTHQLSSGSVSSSRRHPALNSAGYLHSSLTTRAVNYLSVSSRNSSPVPGHSSFQSMHAQATAQMALLMDHQRRELRDASRQPEDASQESFGIAEQSITLGYGRQSQQQLRFEAEASRWKKAQEQEFSQKSAMLALQQQSLRDRSRSGNTSFQDSNSSQSQEDFCNSGSTSQFEAVEYDDPPIPSIDTQLTGRERDSFPGSYDLGYRVPTLSPVSMGDIQSEFRFTDRAGEPYLAPPVLGMVRKQQAMAMNMAYHRDANSAGSVLASIDIPPPPPSLSPLLMRNLSTDSIGCGSPSMRHKSALSIACPGPVRERTLSDVNTIAFQMAEACLDSNPSTPKFSHRSFSSSLSGSIGGMNGSSLPDYLGQALRRMNSTDSISSIGSSREIISSINVNPTVAALSLSAPRGYGQVYLPDSLSADSMVNSAGMLGLSLGVPANAEAWASG